MSADSFLESCGEMRKLVFSFADPLIVHHYDADGLSSGAIVSGAFLKEGKKFRRLCVRQLGDREIEACLKEKEVIFVDLGGGNKRVNELQDVVIIDHHQTEGVDKAQANPQLHGLDGSHELSAAGTAYCVFRTHPDLAIVGAVGDMQHPLIGMNRWVLGEGVKSGEVRVDDDVRFYGRYCRGLVQFLAYCDDPYLPGITYREEKAMELLSELGIPLEKDGARRVYADLDEGEKRALVSAMAKILSNANRLDRVDELLGESYVFPHRPRDETFEANEFSTLLNACGRHNRDDVGVKVCLGDQDAHAEAQALLQQHRRALRDGIEFAGSHVQDFGLFYLLDARGIVGDNIIGTVCGMCMQQKWVKPIIGLSLADAETVKISGRAPKWLAAKGLNVGSLMKKAAGENGGIGGGHTTAAGASVPKGKLNGFLLAAGGYVRSVRSQTL